LEKLSRCLFQQNGKRGGGKQSFHVKMECSNPNGTGKDRAALFMLRKAEERGDLPHPSNISKVIDWNHGKHPQANAKAKDLSSNHTTETFQDNDDDDDDETNLMEKTIANATLRTKTGGIVVEGTSGSTGISLATLATQRGHSTIIVMPDDQAMEKQSILKCLGAVVHIVPNAAISNPNHYVNVARRIAMEINKKQIVMDGNGGGEVVVIQAAFMNQFENLANYHAHYSTTGPEIWDQTNGCVDLFCMSSGTGGTISGSGRYLKDSYQKFHPNKTPCRVVLVDPPGSALYNKVKYNVAYASEQQERGLKRHRYDTLAEGIGLDRITQNFTQGVDHGVIDDAVRVTDQEAVDVAHWLLREEGLFVGSSSAMNVAGAIRAVMDAQEKKEEFDCVVTIICDGGQRHLSRFWNRDFIISWGLKWPGDDLDAWHKRLPSCLQGDGNR
jgi:cysteine synthase A